MDMLEDIKMRKVVTQYYENSGELELVRKAVIDARVKEKAHSECNGTGNKSTIHTKLQKWG